MAKRPTNKKSVIRPAERDPNGMDQHAVGAKLDEGKVRVGLMFKDFSRALLAVAQVTTHGALKYTPSGWGHVPNAAERYLDAQGRHLLKGCTEDFDEDSGLDHLAHEAWNTLARLELAIRERDGVKP